jgi:RNA polymerase sigma-70 factor (ECF subfamily)
MTDFNSLYRKYAPDVYRFALFLTNERGAAEDITSETFVRAWASPAPIAMATVKGYLFTIARNLFLQGLREKTRTVALDVDVLDPSAGPHARAEQKQRLGSVLAELEKLPEAGRTALLLHAVEGMRYEEIAKVLDISLAAVKVKIYRARLALAGVRNG